jgi:chemotaxis signal transduction protein
VEFLPFRIAGRDFVVDASRVRTIAPFEGPADRCPVPVIDLRKRLGLPEVYGRRAYLVVVESSVQPGSSRAGFVVDYVSGLITATQRDCRGGKLRAGGRPKLVLDPDSLLITGSPKQANS